MDLCQLNSAMTIFRFRTFTFVPKQMNENKSNKIQCIKGFLHFLKIIKALFTMKIQTRYKSVYSLLKIIIHTFLKRTDEIQ